MSKGTDGGGLSVLRDTFHTELWPLPVLGVALALALGISVPLLDARLADDLPAAAKAYLFGGGADAARTVLSAVSSSLITVTSLTFSLTVVTLQLASSQFSPRLLRTFSRDRVVHVTLALFLGTFTYSLMVLRTVRNSGDDQPDFVPQLAITLAVVLTMASVIGLVLFLAHLARQIRVETILETVHEEARSTLNRVLEPRQDGPATSVLAPTPPPAAVPILVRESGFLVNVDEDELVQAAVEAEAVVLIEGFPGGSLVGGTPLGTSWSIGAQPVPAEAQGTLDERVGKAITAGPERTAAQDIAFGLRQLTDVTNKALSPGTNDPTTAVHALGHISALICEAVEFDLGPKLLRDDQDRIRVVLERPSFADLLDSAISEPRSYGSDSATVLKRIARLLREVGWKASEPGEQQAVREQARRLEETIGQSDFGPAENAGLASGIRQVHQALAGRW